MSAVRGVNVDGVMRTLLARGLVEEAGHDGESGSTLYRTTSYFLERLGLRSIDELPELAPFLPDTGRAGRHGREPAVTYEKRGHPRASGCSGCSPRPGSAAGAPASS